MFAYIYACFSLLTITDQKKEQVETRYWFYCKYKDSIINFQDSEQVQAFIDWEMYFTEEVTWPLIKVTNSE